MTKNTISLFKFLTAFLLLIILLACSKNEDPTPLKEEPEMDTNPPENENQEEDFDKKVATLPTQNEEEINSPLEFKDPQTDTMGSFVCQTQFFKWSPGIEESFLYDPSAPYIFPSSILSLESILTGTFEPINSNRAPINISLSLQNVKKTTDTINQPGLSEVRTKIKDLVNQDINGSTSAKIAFDIQEIYSEEQLGITLGGSYQAAGFGKIGGLLDFQNQIIRSRFVVKFVQEYYSIEVDLKEKPSDYYTQLPNIENFGEKAPVIVSSVKYGRAIFFLMESSLNSSELRLNIDALFSNVDGEVSINYDKKDILEQTNIKTIIIGGSGEEAVKVLSDFSKVEDFIISGGNFSKDSPGVPLAYTLSYLDGGGLAKIILKSEYQVTTCEPYKVKSFSIFPRSGEAFLFCPTRIEGDEEFGGNGPEIQGRVDLLYEPIRREILANVSFTFNEISGDTKATVNELQVIACIPGNEEFVSFKTGQQTSSTSFIDINHALDTTNINSGIIVKRYEVIGDTEGKDLPCDLSEDNSYLKIYFNQFEINVVDE